MIISQSILMDISAHLQTEIQQTSNAMLTSWIHTNLTIVQHTSNMTYHDLGKIQIELSLSTSFKIQYLSYAYSMQFLIDSSWLYLIQSISQTFMQN